VAGCGAKVGVACAPESMRQPSPFQTGLAAHRVGVCFRVTPLGQDHATHDHRFEARPAEQLDDMRREESVVIAERMTESEAI